MTAVPDKPTNATGHSTLALMRFVKAHGCDRVQAQLRDWIRRDGELVDLLRAGIGIGGEHWTDAPGRWEWEQRVRKVIGDA